LNAVNTVVLTPIPSAGTATATMVNPGARRIMRPA
jgi:hypothetical protein